MVYFSIIMVDYFWVIIYSLLCLSKNLLNKQLMSQLYLGIDCLVLIDWIQMRILYQYIHQEGLYETLLPAYNHIPTNKFLYME